jgi:lysophospholipase L1-like esterase
VTDRVGQCNVIERAVELSTGALTLRRIRALESEVVAARQSAGDANLHLLPGPELFGPDDVGDLPDGLHPNAAGYRRMGERFHRLVFEQGPFCR